MANQLGTSRLRFTTENGNAYSSSCKDSYSEQDAWYYPCHGRLFTENTYTNIRKPTILQSVSGDGERGVKMSAKLTLESALDNVDFTYSEAVMLELE